MFIIIFCKYIAKKWKALLVCEDLTIIIQMKYKPLIFGTCRENGGTVVNQGDGVFDSFRESNSSSSHSFQYAKLANFREILYQKSPKVVKSHIFSISDS